MKSRSWIRVAGRTLAAFACAATLAMATRAMATPADLDPLVVQLAGVQNIARPFPWLLTGGQPDEKALAILADAGFWDIVNLRTADEPCEFDEEAAAKAVGLRYLSIPTTAADFTDARFTAFRRQMIAHGPKLPLFVHCGSGNRVGAALLPWLVLDQGIADDRALAMAHEMGLRDPLITQKALDYIRARR